MRKTFTLALLTVGSLGIRMRSAFDMPDFDSLGFIPVVNEQEEGVMVATENPSALEAP